MGFNLTNQYISASFQQLAQVSSSLNGFYLLGGTGSVIPNLQIQAESSLSASYATTASFLLGSIASASYATTASYAVSASHAESATSAGSVSSVAYTDITGKPTLVSGSSQIILQNTTGNLSGSRISGAVASATSASHALQADNATTATTVISFYRCYRRKCKRGCCQ